MTISADQRARRVDAALREGCLAEVHEYANGRWYGCDGVCREHVCTHSSADVGQGVRCYCPKPPGFDQFGCEVSR